MTDIEKESIRTQAHNMTVSQELARKWCQEYNDDFNLYGYESIEVIFDRAVIKGIKESIEALYPDIMMILDFDIYKYKKIYYCDRKTGKQLGLTVGVKQ